MFWHGRAKWRRRLSGEWCFCKHARAFHFSIRFGVGDSDDGLQIIAGIPWLFDIYATLEGVYRCKKTEVGVSIHDHTLWLKTFSLVNEWRSKDPWWKQGLSWGFPWKTRWHSTEILEHKANLPFLPKVIYTEKAHQRGDTESRRAAEVSVSDSYPYTYTLKNGEVQHRRARVFVDRMTWRALWYPLIPIQRSKICINVSFDAEVGEGTGSYKGGVLGCGYEMQFGETPWETLRRMEKERKFER